MWLWTDRLPDAEAHGRCGRSPSEEGGDDYYLNGGYVKLKDAGVAQQNKAAAVQQNQPKETQPDPEEEPDSDNRLSESKPRKNGRRNR